MTRPDLIGPGRGQRDEHAAERDGSVLGGHDATDDAARVGGHRRGRGSAAHLDRGGALASRASRMTGMRAADARSATTCWTASSSGKPGPGQSYCRVTGLVESSPTSLPAGRARSGRWRRPARGHGDDSICHQRSERLACQRALHQRFSQARSAGVSTSAHAGRRCRWRRARGARPARACRRHGSRLEAGT